MSILKVARMGHPVLRQATPLVDPSEISKPEFQRLIDNMFDTMLEYEGIGLAAPQVHEGIRMFVAGVAGPDTVLSPIVIINPKIEPIGTRIDEDWEGCLSIPDVRGRVPRAAEIRVRALDRKGQQQTMTANGFPARVMQHETDHLDGVLFLDRMKSFESLTFIEEYGRYWEKSDS